MHTLTQILGWVGTFLFLLAYYLISNRKMEATGRTYQLMNLFGAICMGISVLYQRAWPAVGLEIIWALIAVMALCKIRQGS